MFEAMEGAQLFCGAKRRKWPLADIPTVAAKVFRGYTGRAAK